MTTRLQRRVVEVDSLLEFDRVARLATSMNGWRLRHVDLTGHSDVLARLDGRGSLFLGCTLADGARTRLESGGALVYPEVPNAPVDEYRAELYTPEELYAGESPGGYAASLDARIYAWSQQREATQPGRRARLATTDLVAQAMHDASIGAALGEVVREIGRPVVGVMGGHGIERTTPEYHEAARLGHRLAGRGALVATGGGPGAMEAANLGAALGAQDADVLDRAVSMLATVPSFRVSVDAWVSSALTVRRDLMACGPSLGIPTWFYGHEPTNVFAGHIAKFFQNSVREAILLERCTGGIVFLPGAAGTVQEVFQDACENYYATTDTLAPMVLVGREHWTTIVPAWPLLQALAEAQGFSSAIALVDRVAEAADFVTSGR